MKKQVISVFRVGALFLDEMYTFFLSVSLTFLSHFNFPPLISLFQLPLAACFIL